jgi:hypothetical protein
LVYFGIIIFAGIPFSLKKGALTPFLMQPAPLLRKKGVPAKFSKKEFLPKCQKGVLDIPTKTIPYHHVCAGMVHRHRPDSQYWYGMHL